MSGGDRRLREFWNRSRFYYELAEEVNPEASPERRHLFSHLGAGDRVLDLGSGSCENALWMPAGVAYTGTDVSTTALAMAGERRRPAHRVRADAAALPFADASFDAVVSTWAIEHFEQPPRTLLEAARVTRPGGLLLFVGSAWDLPHALPPSLERRRRGAAAGRRLWRQLASLADGVARFDVVAEPRALAAEFEPDADAVHVTQSYTVGRFLRAAGLEMVEETSLVHNPNPSPLQRLARRLLGAVPLWRRGWGNLLFVARRGAELAEPPYRVLPL